MIEEYKKTIEKLGPDRVLIGEPMFHHTTFHLGGQADLFYEAKTTEDIVKSVTLCRTLGIPYFILGGGSNLLVSDKGIRGMVIKISNFKFLISNNKIEAGAGVSLSKVVAKAAQAGLAGFEFAVGIPGTFGGAIVGNAGAWQQAVGDKIIRVKILDENGEIRWVTQGDCDFSYRKSRFKNNDNREIVLEAEIQLEHGDLEEIKAKIDIYLERRQKSQPKEPSAGCVFVNPKPHSAGALIELCNLKGVKEGGAFISPKHANFVVNSNNATTQDVLDLINLIKQKVLEKHGIELSEEIKIVGDF